jgi:hypothetical protein
MTKIALTDAIKARRAALRTLRGMARRAEIDTEQLYSAMGDITLWGDDTHEDFGDLHTVAAQVRMLYDEATSRLGDDEGFKLAAKAIQLAKEEN